MNYRPHYTVRALKDLDMLDKKITKRILDKIDFYCLKSNPLLQAKKLTNFPFGSYRFRIGDHRVLFDLDDKGKIIILIILTVRHRREAYNI